MREVILEWLRACVGCGNSNGKTPWLCSSCYELWRSKVNLKQQILHKKLRHIYGVDWRGDDEFISTLVYSLKGRGLWLSYCREVEAFISHPLFHEIDVIYYPSKGIQDHGYQWAQAFSLYLDRPIYPLISESLKKQASLSRNKRLSRKFKPLKLQGKKPLFVDDIVTSGATVKAAHEALGQPENLTIWSLFYRRNL